MAESIDQKMAVDEESIDANDNENEAEEEERKEGGLRKMRRSEEDEDKEEMEEDTLVTKLDLPPGHQEHQKLKEHMFCLANHTKRN